MKLSVSPDAAILLTKMRDFLAGKGVRAYLVGGFIRDTLLGRPTADIDIAVADGLEIARDVSKALGGTYVLLDAVNGVARVVIESGSGRSNLDFSTLRGDIEADLAERDFTINAMAMELTDAVVTLDLSSLIDPLGGRRDIENRVIRAVSEKAFEADPARLLRAVRFAAELGFSIESATELLVRLNSSSIASVAGERVREELLHILALPGAGGHVSRLNDLGLLTALIPELAGARGVSQPTVHYWDVFEHSLRTVAAIDFLLREGDWPYASAEVLAAVPWSSELGAHFRSGVGNGSNRASLLRLAALLHDIAKPQTKTMDENGRARFLGHGKEGSVIAVAVLERLRFSGKEIKLVQTMVEHHLRPGQLSAVGLPTHRAIYRYFRDANDAGFDILFLSMADHLATRGPTLDLPEWQRHARLTAYVLEQYYAQKSKMAPPKLIDGNDLMNIFGLAPGRKLGEFLEMVHEAQASGEVTSRDEALAWVRSLLLRTNTERN